MSYELKTLKRDYRNPQKYTPERKMQVLVENYDVLIKADKTRKENRAGK